MEERIELINKKKQQRLVLVVGDGPSFRKRHRFLEGPFSLESPPPTPAPLPIKPPQRTALALLHALIPQEDSHSRSRQLSDLWPTVWGERKQYNSVAAIKQADLLRKALGDTQTKTPYISRQGETLRLLADFHRLPVSASGATGTIKRPGQLDYFPTWDDETYAQLLRTIGPDPRASVPELMLLSTNYFHYDNLGIQDALDKGARVAVLFSNKEIITSRFAMRTDMGSISKVLSEAEELARDMNHLRGQICVRIGDSLPHGYVVITRSGAVVSLFLATKSYKRNPMFVCSNDHPLYDRLVADFRLRWLRAKESTTSYGLVDRKVDAHWFDEPSEQSSTGDGGDTTQLALGLAHDGAGPNEPT